VKLEMGDTKLDPGKVDAKLGNTKTEKKRETDQGKSAFTISNNVKMEMGRATVKSPVTCSVKG
jgi:hypothetical protein